MQVLNQIYEFVNISNKIQILFIVKYLQRNYNTIKYLQFLFI